MMDQFARTRLLLGDEAMDRLKNARVAVFGIGGVGSYVVEALARSGVGALDLVDDDQVCLTNLNRQLIATHSALGQYKVDVAKARVLDIAPDTAVTTHRTFYLPETADQFDFSEYDYVVDAIDTVTGKLQLIQQAKAAGVPIICSMGTGNKLDPTQFRVADISQTSVCPLARIMRKECQKRGIKHVKAVYSTELALEPLVDPEDPENHVPGRDTIREGSRRRATPGSNAFVPAVAGLIIAGEVIKDLAGIN